MPTIYLSPSTQEFNSFVIGGSEEYYMNLIADAMIPYLEANAIQYTRNTTDMTAASSIAQSNAGNYDLHLAIHSNASAEGQAGRYTGPVIYHYPTSTNGLRASEIIAQNFRNIYPNPELVRIFPTTSIGEVSRTRAPSAYIEVAYHDDVEDATWIRDNIDLIAQTIVTALAQYFYNEIGSQQNGDLGTVTLQSGYLNIRSGPSLNSPVIAMVPNGSILRIIAKSGDWYNIDYNGTVGFVYSQYISV